MERLSIAEIVEEFEENAYPVIAGVERCAIKTFIIWTECPEFLAYTSPLWHFLEIV
jgi:hypothetical protein